MHNWGRNQRSPQAEAYRKLYRTARWRHIRKDTLLRDMFTCQRCCRLMHERQLECHHVHPEQKSSAQTFFDGPFVTLCNRCHSGPVQQQERIGYSTEVGQDGWPTDERHPANL